jgi:hypothetical protein
MSTRVISAIEDLTRNVPRSVRIVSGGHGFSSRSLGIGFSCLAFLLLLLFPFFVFLVFLNWKSVVEALRGRSAVVSGICMACSRFVCVDIRVA